MKNNKDKNSKDLSKKIKPLGDRVLILPLSETELAGKTSSGIIIPETINKERPEKGKVVAVGEGKYDDGKLIPIKVSVGDIVLFSKYTLDEVKIDGVDYLITSEANILAIIK